MLGLFVLVPNGFANVVVATDRRNCKLVLILFMEVILYYYKQIGQLRIIVFTPSFRTKRSALTVQTEIRSWSALFDIHAAGLGTSPEIKMDFVQILGQMW